MEEWVRKFKKKGIAIEDRNGRYYAYKISSVWDKKLKRSRKITEKYLGVVTPHGIIKKHSFSGIRTDYEYGNVMFLFHLVSDDLIPLLKKFYPHDWERMISFSILRCDSPLPLKSVRYLFDKTYLKKMFPRIKMSSKALTNLIDYLGRNNKISDTFMKKLVTPERYLIIDLSYIFSYSQNIVLLERGYNKEHFYLPQINLLLGFSREKKVPSFLRVLPGSIRDVSTVVNTIKLFNIKNAVLITDRGFYSSPNVRLLTSRGIDYIIPLKRNSKLIPEVSEEFDGVFLYKSRPIKYWVRQIDNRKLYTFEDNSLRGEEEGTFLRLITEDKRKKDEFLMKKISFGKIYLLSTLDEDAESIYLMFKEKENIEYSFNMFKNTLESDKLYTRDDDKLLGYLFLNFLSLYIRHKALNKIRESGLKKRFSLGDILLQLSKVKLYEYDDGNMFGEIPKKVREIMEKLNIEHITQKSV